MFLVLAVTVVVMLAASLVNQDVLFDACVALESCSLNVMIDVCCLMSFLVSEMFVLLCCLFYRAMPMRLLMCLLM